MKLCNKSIALILAAVMVLSWLLCVPLPVKAAAADYIAASYPASLSVQTTQAVNLMDVPSTDGTAKYTLPENTTLTVNKLHQNTTGGYFYQVLYYEQTLYIDATAVTMLDHLTGDITVADLMSPAALGYGQGFPISGTISSTLCSSKQRGDTLTVTLLAECVEEIGKSVPILTEEPGKSP